MTNVIDGAARFQRPGETIGGTMVCMACGHRHDDMTAPPGPIPYACESCGAQRLAWKHALVPPKNEYVMVCRACGAQSFTILSKGVMCQGCGTRYESPSALGNE